MRHLIWLFLLMVPASLFSNNIGVTNLGLKSQNETEGFVMVNFDLHWENSWNLAQGNWDAAWVFVKFRVDDGPWQHANLDMEGHLTGKGTPLEISPARYDESQPFHSTDNPAVGVFIYKSETGSGTFSATDIELKWNYAANGIQSAASVDVKLFAIEMVYVPTGSFNVGGTGTEGGNAFTPTTIFTANATVAPSGTGKFGGMQGGYPTGETVPDSSAWPNGFTAFYSMKYEISQQQYVDFLNTLTPTQQANRVANPLPTTNRYGITESGGVYSTSKPFVACNFISWADGVAYADWAGLRPMTELEFEKACRGNVQPVTGEYAWGTATVNGLSNTLSDDGLSTEEIASNYSTTAGNANYGNSFLNGPVRVGIYASNTANTGRITAGATLWGIMEMSGNLYEGCVSLREAAGRAFLGNNGDGNLDTAGGANENTWPAADAVGSISRGGGFNGASEYMKVTERITYVENGRGAAYGFRAVRFAPVPEI